MGQDMNLLRSALESAQQENADLRAKVQEVRTMPRAPAASRKVIPSRRPTPKL